MLSSRRGAPNSGKDEEDPASASAVTADADEPKTHPPATLAAYARSIVFLTTSSASSHCLAISLFVAFLFTLFGFCLLIRFSRPAFCVHYIGETFYEKVGTTYYMAPEIMKRKYGCQVDIWSSGVIFYVLLCGYPPFIADSEKGIEREILRAIVKFEEQPWPQVSERAKDLIRKMLHPHASKRITADQALRHPWFKMINVSPQLF